MGVGTLRRARHFRAGIAIAVKHNRQTGRHLYARTLSKAVEHARGCVAINIGRFDMVKDFVYIFIYMERSACNNVRILWVFLRVFCNKLIRMKMEKE